MKRSLFLIMALLLATPAMGAVVITCVDEGSGVVRIDYDASSEGELVRAFALDVSISAGTITVVSDFQTGEGDKYGIFPGTIDLTDPNVPVWGSPVAPATDPGAAGTGIGTDRVILEMGSLYDPAGTAPGTTGTLCKVTVDTSCDVTIIAEPTRGGVVMEDGSTPTLTSAGCSVVIQVGPECWTYDAQCHGDTDGDCDVDTTDWPTFRDGFGTSYPSADYITYVCADFDHDGDIDTTDWPNFRDNFGSSCPTLPEDCPGTGTWPPL